MLDSTFGFSARKSYLERVAGGYRYLVDSHHCCHMENELPRQIANCLSMTYPSLGSTPFIDTPPPQ